MIRNLSWAGLLAALTLFSTPSFAQVVAFDCFPINQAQEVPPTGSPGSGVGNAWFDPITSTLHWNISYGGLTGAVTSAHFHGPAAPGSNAGVQISIGTANPAVGSQVLTAAQAADVQAGLWYANVHTTAFAGGEIRGQIVNVGCVVAMECFPITGNQEVPPVPTPGAGKGSAWLNRNNRRLNWNISYGGLLGAVTSAHFHGPALPGSNAGVQVSLGTANPNSGSTVLSTSQASDVTSGLWYANVHTTAFAGGEIRGQVVNVGCPEWMNTGNGKPGDRGTPALVGVGPLTAGSANQVDLINGRPLSTTNLILGLGTLNINFKGGVLVPTADILFLGLPTDANGGNSIPFVWPAGIPAGANVWLQEWVNDPGAHVGLSATNGLRLTAM